MVDACGNFPARAAGSYETAACAVVGMGRSGDVQGVDTRFARMGWVLQMIREHRRALRYNEPYTPFERPVVTTQVAPVDDGSDEWQMMYGQGHNIGPLIPDDRGILILIEHRFGFGVRRYGL